jgi:hypothetical protein
MTSTDREPSYLSQPPHRSGRTSSWLARQPELHDDPLLEIAFTIAEFAITVVGPFYWVCLVSLFLVAELAG